MSALVLGLLLLACVPLARMQRVQQAAGDPWTRLSQLGIAAGLGFGLLSITHLLALQLFGSSPLGLYALVALLGCAALAGLLSLRAATRDLRLWPRVRSQQLVAILACCVLVFAFWAQLEHAASLPHGRNDSWAIWNLKARFLARAPEHCFGFLDYADRLHHADYPLHLPTLVALVWRLVPGEPNLAPILLGQLAFCGVLLLACCSVARHSGRSAMLLFLLLASSPVLVAHGSWQLADLPLGFYLLSAFVALQLGEQKPKALQFLLFGFLLGCGAWVKNEGQMYFVVASLGLLLSLRVAKLPLSSMGWVLLGALPWLALGIWYKLSIAGASEVVRADNFSLEKLADPERYRLILLAWIKSPLALSCAGALLYLAACGARNLRQQPALLAGWLLVLLGTLSFWVIYLFTPHNLAWHLDTAALRLQLQMWPLCLWLCMQSARPPGQVLAAN